MKKILCAALALALLCGLCACKPAFDTEAPAFYDYQLTFNGRTYSTAGCPVRNEGTVSGLARELTAEVTGSTFPAGTRFYAITGAELKVRMAAVEESGEAYYFLYSYDDVRISSGKSVLAAVEMENDFAQIWQLSEDQKKMRLLPLDSSALIDFADAFRGGALAAPEGARAELLIATYLDEDMRMTLYENGAIVYAACPQYAVQLDDEMAARLWNLIKK